MFIIEEELKKLPAKPGVYIMHGEKDEIIYVGKAISLKNRVRQYFQSSRNKGAKIERMVTHITRFEYIITDSELEALVLECNLIKEHRPKYNTMLKDDKSYPFIKVTVHEPYPRVLFARRMKKDKARYFGPYTSGGAVKDVIELVRKLYQVRSCNRSLPRDTGKDRPCLYYHMKQCKAPCQGYVSQEEYRKNINKVIKFLNGDFQDAISELMEKMQKASEEMRYEDAMEYRDLISSIRKIGERQKITGYGQEDRDIIAVAMDDSEDLRDQDAVVQVFFIRDGRLIGRDHFYLRVAKGDTKAQVLSSFLKQFYAGTPFIPSEIMLQSEIEDADIIEEWLSGRRKQKVHIRVPKKGTKEKLVELALENARMVLAKDRERIRREEGRTIGAVHEVEEWLGLKNVVRMEAYDISNISGFESVGSMVVYEKGRPKRSDYRKFKIKWVQGPNDYASMEEVLTRRFTHESNGEFDLVVEIGQRPVELLRIFVGAVPERLENITLLLLQLVLRLTLLQRERSHGQQSRHDDDHDRRIDDDISVAVGIVHPALFPAGPILRKCRRGSLADRAGIGCGVAFVDMSANAAYEFFLCHISPILPI